MGLTNACLVSFHHEISLAFTAGECGVYVGTLLAIVRTLWKVQRWLKRSEYKTKIVSSWHMG